MRESSASCFLSAWLSAPGARRARTPGGAAWPLESAGQPGTLVRDARAPLRSPSAVCAPDPSRRLCPEGLAVAPALPGVGGGCGAGEAPGDPGPQVLACNRHPRVSAAELPRPRTGCSSCIRETRKHSHHELAKSSLLPTPVFLPGVSHGQRSLAGYSPWGRTESDTHTHTHTGPSLVPRGSLIRLSSLPPCRPLISPKLDLALTLCSTPYLSLYSHHGI